MKTASWDFGLCRALALCFAGLAFAGAAHAAAPRITSATTASGRVAYDFRYSIQTDAFAGSYQATGLPPGLRLETGTREIVGVPTTAGSFNATVSATNADGTGSIELALTIEPAPTEPPAVTVRSTFESHYVFYDYPAGTFFSAVATNFPRNFTAQGLPTTGYFARDRDAFVVDYNYATPGIHHVTFTAENPAGSHSAQMVWSVRPALLGRGLDKSEYRIGETIRAAVGFNSPVIVTGTPVIPFSLGNERRDIRYVSGSGTDRLHFEYQTTIDDFVGVEAHLGPVELRGGSIKHSSGLDAVLTYPRQTIGERLPTLKIIGPVEILGPRSAAATVASDFRLQVQARNWPGRWEADGLPAGLVIDNSGVISGVPTTSGVYSVALRAFNGLVPEPGTATLVLTISDTPTGRPTITEQPPSRAAAFGSSVTLAVATTSANATFSWDLNGRVFPVTTNTLTVSNVGPAEAGIYTATVTEAGQSSVTTPAILGVATTAKVIGNGSEVGPNIVHQNLNVYDQVLLQGPAAAVTADSGQIVRLSYLDLTDDIVQVEFSGAGTLSLVLDSPSGPMTATNYNQPGVSYWKGHAGIVISGADETTHVSIFSVGRITAVNQALFKPEVAYDGVVDLAFVAIYSGNGKFGGLRAANASFWATRGLTGVYAPAVHFTGPVYVCDIIAAENATPTLLLGSSTDVRITGGDLSQTNGRAVQVRGIAQLRFVDGITSQGNRLPALPNRGRLEQDGRDVTTQITVNP